MGVGAFVRRRGVYRQVLLVAVRLSVSMSMCVQEVSEEQVDVNSAYILFYERQILDSGKYMPDIADKEPVTVDVDDEFEKDFKKFCIVQ